RHNGEGATLKNTIVALNTIAGTASAPDISNVPGDSRARSLGHNLIGIGDDSLFVNGVDGDQVGSIVSPLNPGLGPLQNNGGPTLTMALLPGSPAIDKGDDSVLASPLFLTTDQRGAGFPRKWNTHVDVGAFEFQIAINGCLRDNATGNVFQFNS